MERKSKDELYLDVAESMLGRATCLRRVYGAVIVNNDEIISTGYNGSPRGRVNCTDRGTCRREELNVPQGERYELCCSVHAEQNAIISAPRYKMIGAKMYLAGKNVKTQEILTNAEPCEMCKRFIINAGIEQVISKTSSGITTQLVQDWVDGE